jgi:hypothetical protein
VNLPKRIGAQAFEKLNELAATDKKQDFKWDRQELKALYIYYRDKIKTL